MDKKPNQYKSNAKQLLKVIRTKEDEFLFGLYLLKTCYKTNLRILETFCGGLINIPDPYLNSCYLQCQKQTKIILDSQEEIHNKIGDPPRLFESLVGDIEEADQEWELGYRQAARNYYGKIENLFVQNGSKSYELPKFIQDFFDYTKRAINNHIKSESIYRELFGLIPEKEKIIKIGELTVNLKKAQLQYKTNKAIEISPTKKEVVFLLLLIKNSNSVIEYKDIAKELNLNCYHQNVTNEDVAREVQFLRRNLVGILRSARIPQSEIRKLIIAKTNLGYKLNSL